MLTPEIIITVLIVGLATAITRFLPFIVFREDKPTPKYIVYLGKVLPAAIFGFLVIYCFKDINITSINETIPALISLTVTVLLHIWRKNTLLSIASGTVIYMLLVQFVFIG